MSWRKNRVPGQNLTSRDLTPVAELNAASVLSQERFLLVAAGGKQGPRCGGAGGEGATAAGAW